MNCFLLTQEDNLYLPAFFDRLLSALPDDIRVVGAAVLKGEVQSKNTRDYLRLLGARGVLGMGTRVVGHRLLDAVDERRPLPRPHSVAGALRRHRIPIHRPASINDSTFHDQLRALGVDLLVSVACPQIVRADLLGVPPKGCLNIHGALLPRYRGKMPSFWVLANGEEETGVTVHFMNEKLDDGPIVLQRRVPIAPDDTLHSLIYKSKVHYGSAALAEAVVRIATGDVRLQPNDRSRMTYHSFPTPEAIADFRRLGRRVI